MAKMKGRLVDRNRLAKKYSYVRAPKRLTYLGNRDMELEAVQVSFNNESSKRINFEFPFNDANYQVSLTSRQTASEGVDSAGVTLSVNSVDKNENGFTILASAPFTGEVDVLVVKIS